MIDRNLQDSIPADIATSTGKVLPPLAVVGASVAGMTLQDWVMVATLFYTVVQTLWLIYRIFFGQKGGKGHDKAG